MDRLALAPRPSHTSQTPAGVCPPPQECPAIQRRSHKSRRYTLELVCCHPSTEGLARLHPGAQDEGQCLGGPLLLLSVPPRAEGGGLAWTHWPGLLTGGHCPVPATLTLAIPQSTKDWAPRTRHFHDLSGSMSRKGLSSVFRPGRGSLQMVISKAGVSPWLPHQSRRPPIGLHDLVDPWALHSLGLCAIDLWLGQEGRLRLQWGAREQLARRRKRVRTRRLQLHRTRSDKEFCEFSGQRRAEAGPRGFMDFTPIAVPPSGAATVPGVSGASFPRE